ncbi:MAG: hypothetical protein WC984_00395 [Bacteroidales bacterium]
MRKTLFILIALIAVNLKAYTQGTIDIEIVGDNRPYTEIFESMFRNVRYDTLSTKILYSKVIIT